MPNQIGKNRWLFLRYVIGIGLIFLLLLKVKPREIGAELKGFNFWYILPLLILTFVLTAISCWKWKILLKARGISVGFWKLMSMYVMGYFFNTFMPSNVGGDVIRGYIFGKEIESAVESYASVFLERFTGLSALVFVSFVAFLIKIKFVLSVPLLAISMSIVYAGYIFLLLLILNDAVRNLFAKIFHIKRLSTAIEKLGKFHEAIISFKTKRNIIIQALVISFAFHTLTSVNAYIACLSLGIQINFIPVMLVIPIILLVSMLPITPWALGLWEWAFQIFYTQLGAAPEQGTAVAVLLRAKNLAAAFLGGILFLFWKKAEQLPAEKSGEYARKTL